MRKRMLAVGAAICVAAACATLPPSWPTMTGLSSPELYEKFCASCHGIDGHGNGPVAPLIKIHVPDLTRIAYREGGEFPTEDVRRTIDGRWDRSAHGSRDMPVWGWQFYDTMNKDDSAERARTESMISRLVNYLRSIQQE